MSEWKEFLNEQLKEPEVRAEWDALEPEFAMACREAVNQEAIDQQYISRNARGVKIFGRFNSSNM